MASLPGDRTSWVGERWRGNRDRQALAAFEFNLESNLLRLQEQLQTQTYQPGNYHNFYIYEPKRCLVSAAPFRDRHRLCKVIEPIWEARFIHHSYACRMGKGTHAALDQCQTWVHQYRHAFHGSVVKYYPSIDHQNLKTLLARRIADQQTLWLINRIINRGAGIQADESPQTGFPNSTTTPSPASAASR